MTLTTPSPISDQAAGEPVAWRYLTPTGWHATTDVGKALRVKEHHTVEPLGVLSTAPTTGSAPVAWMRTYRQFSDVPIDPDPGYLVTSFHQNADYAAKYPSENLPLYAAPASPTMSVLTDERILALWTQRFNGCERTHEASVINFARSVLAASMGGDRS